MIDNATPQLRQPCCTALSCRYVSGIWRSLTRVSQTLAGLFEAEFEMGALQVDRPRVTPQRCGEVESQMFDLFAQLGASEEQLDFPVLYASAREVGRQLHAPPHQHMHTHNCWPNAVSAAAATAAAQFI